MSAFPQAIDNFYSNKHRPSLATVFGQDDAMSEVYWLEDRLSFWTEEDGRDWDDAPLHIEAITLLIDSLE